MVSYDWAFHFHTLFDQAVASHRSGRREASTYFDESQANFLNGIGCSPQEIYDFAEDFNQGGEPDFGTALLITAVRRDYFLEIQKGQHSGAVLPADTLPARKDDIGGVEWLPRIIEKARRKLQGTMDPDIMFCCGGDRAFLKRHSIHPADFLRLVWRNWDDENAILLKLTGNGKG